MLLSKFFINELPVIEVRSWRWNQCLNRNQLDVARNSSKRPERREKVVLTSLLLRPPLRRRRRRCRVGREIRDYRRSHPNLLSSDSSSTDRTALVVVARASRNRKEPVEAVVEADKRLKKSCAECCHRWVVDETHCYGEAAVAAAAGTCLCFHSC